MVLLLTILHFITFTNVHLLRGVHIASKITSTSAATSTATNTATINLVKYITISIFEYIVTVLVDNCINCIKV